MTDFAAITSFLNLLGLSGLAAFIVWTIKGLNQRIAALTQLAQEQTKTLDTVRTRAQEFEKLSQGYKQALLDFQEMGKKLEEKRGELLKELESANERKDQELVRLKELQLEEVALKKQSLEKVSQLEGSLSTAVNELQKQLEILAPASWPRETSARGRIMQLFLFGNIWRRLPGSMQSRETQEWRTWLAASLFHDIGHGQLSLFDVLEKDDGGELDTGAEQEDNKRDEDTGQQSPERNK